MQVPGRDHGLFLPLYTIVEYGVTQARHFGHRHIGSDRYAAK